jgi:hypothetical protein
VPESDVVGPFFAELLEEVLPICSVLKANVGIPFRNRFIIIKHSRY